MLTMVSHTLGRGEQKWTALDECTRSRPIGAVAQVKRNESATLSVDKFFGSSLHLRNPVEQVAVETDVLLLDGVGGGGTSEGQHRPPVGRESGHPLPCHPGVVHVVVEARAICL